MGGERWRNIDRKILEVVVRNRLRISVVILILNEHRKVLNYDAMAHRNSEL